MTPLELHDRARQLAITIGRERGISDADILGRRKTRYATTARHELYTRLWREGIGIAEVGRTLDRDHTTVLYGIRKVLGADAYAAEMKTRLEAEVKAGRMSPHLASRILRIPVERLAS